MSDQARLLKWNEALRTENLLYLAPQKDENSNKYYAEAYIKRGRYKDGVYYQTPKMRINKITDEYIEFKFSAETERFFKYLQDFDERNIDIAYKNRKNWYKSNLDRETIDSCYRSLLTVVGGDVDENIDKEAYIRFFYDKNSEDLFYDENDKKINFEDIEVNNYGVCIINYIGLRFLKRQFFPQKNILKLRIASHIRKSNPNNFNFIDESDYETDNDDSQDLNSNDENENMNENENDNDNDENNFSETENKDDFSNENFEEEKEIINDEQLVREENNETKDGNGNGNEEDNEEDNEEESSFSENETDIVNEEQIENQEKNEEKNEEFNDNIEIEEANIENEEMIEDKDKNKKLEKKTKTSEKTNKNKINKNKKKVKDPLSDNDELLDSESLLRNTSNFQAKKQALESDFEF